VYVRIASQMTPIYTPNQIYPILILILSAHIPLGFSSGLLPSDFPTKISYTFLVSRLHAFYYPTHLLLLKRTWDDIARVLKKFVLRRGLD